MSQEKEKPKGGAIRRVIEKGMRPELWGGRVVELVNTLLGIRKEKEEFVALGRIEEQKVNSLFPKLIPEDLWLEFEVNPDHGWSHSRRDEQNLKLIWGSSPEIWQDENFRVLLLPSFLAVRYHDLMQISSKGKTAHAELSALYLILNLKKNQKEFGISDEVIWQAAVMIYYHNKPEEIIEPDSLKFLHPQEILKRAEEKLATTNLRLFDYCPCFKEYKDEIRKLRRSVRYLKIPDWVVTSRRQEALRKMSLFFAIADKIDSMGRYSTLRTLLTKESQGRPFYKKISDSERVELGESLRGAGINLENLDPLSQEIQLRALRVDPTSCDLDLFIYEIIRDFSRFGINNFVKGEIRESLLHKIRELESLILCFKQKGEGMLAVNQWLRKIYQRREKDFSKKVRGKRPDNYVTNRINEMEEEREKLGKVIEEKIGASDPFAPDYLQEIIFRLKEMVIERYLGAPLRIIETKPYDAP